MLRQPALSITGGAMAKMNSRELKQQLLGLLRQGDFDGVLEFAGSDRRIVGALASCTYDRKSEISWRAIHFLGKIVGAFAESDYDFARETVRKLMWSANDESGNFGCSVPEILGEAVRANAGYFLDIIPIVFSYYEDDVFKAGVLYAMGRIGEVHPQHVREYLPLVDEGLLSSDPAVCAQALMAVQRLKLSPDLLDVVKGRHERVEIYAGGKLYSASIEELAKAEFAATGGENA